MVNTGLIEDVRKLALEVEDFHNASDSREVRRADPEFITRRFWRNIGLFSTFIHDGSVSQDTKTTLWEWLEPAGLISWANHPARIVFLGDSESIDSETIPQSRASEYLTGLIKENRPGKGKNQAAAKGARVLADEFIDAVSSRNEKTIVTENGETEEIDPAAEIDFLSKTHGALTTIYLLTILSGNKGTYDIIADKFNKIIRIIEQNHNLKDGFYNGMAEHLNNKPEELAYYVAKQKELGAREMYLSYSLIASLLDMARGLRDLKQYSAEAREQYKKVLELGLTDGMMEYLTTPYQTMVERNQALKAPKPEQATQPEPIQIDALETLQPMQLKWEVLPPGELEENARQIVSSATEKERKPIRIDLERLMSLALIRQLWGEDKCYYARGSFPSRGIKQGEGERLADEYLILVMQEIDSDGKVIAEHCIADSPVVGPHSAYVYRQDVGKDSAPWRQVMSMPKKDAREYGARQLKHTLSQGQDNLPEVMAKKALYLLICTPEDFSRIKFKGNGRISLGKAATQQSLRTDLVTEQ